MVDIQTVLDAVADLKSTVERRLTAVDERLAPMRAQLDGLPLINRAVTVTQQEVRALRAAFKDFALANPAVGEIEALHHHGNRVQAENAELGAKVAMLERLVRELQAR